VNIVEFFKENWGILITSCIAISGIILMYWIHCKGKTEKEREFKENIQIRLGTLEKSMELLTTLYPQLKSLEKLDSFKKLNLTQEDIRKIVSEVLQTTNIIPEAIELKVEEKIEKKLNSFDDGIATIIAQKLNLIDKQFGKPTGNTSDYLTLASVEYSKGNYLTTTQYLNKAIELNPNYDIAWYNKGVALGKLALHNEALKAYGKAIEINPNYAKAWYGKGYSFNKLALHNEALKAYDKAIELNPNYAVAWYGKANAFNKLALHNEALKAYDKAIELNPNYDIAWYNKGVALGKLALHNEALKAYDKAIEINSNYADAWYGKAYAYYSKRDKKNALKCLSEAIKLDPKYKKYAKKFENI
jgi:tetratricopeptide (TPR) repeat protein